MKSVEKFEQWIYWARPDTYDMTYDRIEGRYTNSETQLAYHLFTAGYDRATVDIKNASS